MTHGRRKPAQVPHLEAEILYNVYLSLNATALTALRGPLKSGAKSLSID